ncbi:zinc ABC transporter substrate-binding protein [Thiomicrorhabdus sp.]|uniref:zinc ABC transporter substrate-binding protein n=1 Tax=Thiomicrorhabdus sp. TaxID=2039724 RepID=UPI0035686FA8
MMKQIIRNLFGGIFLLSMTSVYAAQITVSIPPLAGIVSPLLDDEDELHVLLKPGVSPHGFQLKPSHLLALKKSDLAIAVGTPVDAWLDKALTHYENTVIKLSELEGVKTLPARQGGLWEKSGHSHGDEQDVHAQHDEVDSHEKGHQDEHEDEHEQLRNDGHLWLSIDNVRLLISETSRQLQILKPNKAKQIQQRAAAWLQRLENVDGEIAAQLKPVKNQPFVVLHDAYQYFEKHYGLNGVGSIRLNPEIAPSLKRVQAVRERIQQQGIRCVFKEPQFPAKRISAVVSGLDVKVGSLDPMGVYSADGTRIESEYKTYDQLLTRLANAMSDCLAAAAE